MCTKSTLRALAIKLEKVDRIPPTSIASNISAILKFSCCHGQHIERNKNVMTRCELQSFFFFFNCAKFYQNSALDISCINGLGVTKNEKKF